MSHHAHVGASVLVQPRKYALQGKYYTQSKLQCSDDCSNLEREQDSYCTNWIKIDLFDVN